MAVKDIPALVAAGALAGTDLFPLTQGSNVPVKGLLSALATFVAAAMRTVTRLASPINNSSVTPANITGFAFTPAANKTYRFRAHLLTRTALTGTGIIVGFATLPTGLDDFAAYSTQVSGSDTTSNVKFYNAGGLQSTNANVADNTNTWLITVQGIVVAGATPSGTVQMTIASEVAASQVTVRTGSVFEVEEVI